MIPTWPEILALATAAAVFFTVLGLPLARLLAPAGFAALGLAPALGWAVFSVVALPVLTFAGFGRLHVGLLCAVALAAGVAWHRRAGTAARFPFWALPLAGVVAVLPVLALMPKHVAGGLLLAPPMFDHVKAAIVDAILRDGLPIRNPFLGLPGAPPFAYYYLWHFSVAVLASAAGVSGWTADAAMAGVTAWASLVLMMGLALAVGRRNIACVAVACLAVAGTARPVLGALFGPTRPAALVPSAGDLEGWLFQAAWVPQHLASACCLVLSVLLMLAMAEGAPLLAVPVLGLAAAAGFESSTWIGGVTFAVVAPAVAAVLLLSRAPALRLGLAARLAAAACVTLVVAMPFAATQLASVAARADGAPVALMPYQVFGPGMPASWRGILDVPAFWLLLVPATLPAIALPGLIGLACAALCGLGGERARLGVLSAAILPSLVVASLLRSVIDNNDLGWRAVLPSVLLLTGLTGGMLARLAGTRRWMALGAVLACLVISLPAGILTAVTYAHGRPSPDAAALAGAPALWDAVRRVTGPEERVLNNPLFLADVTTWSDNISWALLSDRASCYAGWQAVVAYGGLKRARLDALSAAVQRVFGGAAASGDIETLVRDFGCRVFIIVPGDGAWNASPFAGNAAFTLLESAPERWRIYRWGAR